MEVTIVCLKFKTNLHVLCKAENYALMDILSDSVIQVKNPMVVSFKADQLMLQPYDILNSDSQATICIASDCIEAVYKVVNLDITSAYNRAISQTSAQRSGLITK